MRLWRLAMMGNVDSGVIHAVGKSLADCFGATVQHFRLPEPDYAYDPRRNQYGSVAVLHKLLESQPAGGSKLLAITERDLFIPMLTFVYGQAQLDGAIGVISLARLRQEFYGMPPDETLLEMRARKEALHEAGHMLGLVHCNDRRCAMALATNIRQLDGKNTEFCPACARRMRIPL